MYLIDVVTLNLKYFTKCPAGQYAILSHTWEDGEELDYETFNDGGGRDWKGFKKIEYCCRQAARDGYSFAWVDTCCIDKKSSAELTEAINSMYNWYKQAGVCYAYLADYNTVASSSVEGLGRCKWFTRGWTLQELVAPAHVIFFGPDWQYIHTRTRLASHLNAITGIEKAVLVGGKDPKLCSVAQRMSWAASRTTTRVEDTAYCLIGLFGVSMPLLYGEEQTAFLRLQETIIANSDDESIFAWTGVGPEGSGLLAKSPLFFRHAGNVEAVSEQWSRPPYRMTQFGLEIEFQLEPLTMNEYTTPLQCRRVKTDGQTQHLSIYICRTTSDNSYRRVAVNNQDIFCSSDSNRREGYYPLKRTICINDRIVKKLSPHGMLPTIKTCDASFQQAQDAWESQTLHLRTQSLPHAEMFSYSKVSTLPLELIGFSNGEWLNYGSSRPISNLARGLSCSLETHAFFPQPSLCVGFNPDFEPICLLAPHNCLPTFSGISLHSITEYDDLTFTQCLSQRERCNPLYYTLKGSRHVGLQATVTIQEAKFWNMYLEKIIEIEYTPAAGSALENIVAWNLRVKMRRRRMNYRNLASKLVHDLTALAWHSFHRGHLPSTIIALIVVISVMVSLADNSPPNHGNDHDHDLLMRMRGCVRGLALLPIYYGILGPLLRHVGQALYNT